MSNPKLKPCPFCGAPATIEPWHGGSATKKLIECSNAGTDLCPVGPAVTGETTKKAAVVWNRREPDWQAKWETREHKAKP